MKINAKALLRHRAAQIVVFIAATGLALTALGVHAAGKGRFAGRRASLTWLDADNTRDELNISQAPSGAFTASPDLPVLLVVCSKEACLSEDLGLLAALRRFDGKVKVLVVNPYKEKEIVQAIEATFIAPAIKRALAITLAQQYVAQMESAGNQSFTAAQLGQLIQDPQFLAQVEHVLSNEAAFRRAAPQLYALTQPGYPKFFMFAPKTFEVVNAGTGVDIGDEDALVAFVQSTLDQLAAEDGAAIEKVSERTANDTQ